MDAGDFHAGDSHRTAHGADLGAIYAYLQSIPPIKNRVPEPLPPGATTAAAEK
jgi:hypothetical protein